MTVSGASEHSKLQVFVLGQKSTNMLPSASQKSVPIIFPAQHMDLASIFGDGGTNFHHQFMIFNRKSSPSAACYRSNINGTTICAILCSSVTLYLVHGIVSNAKFCYDSLPIVLWSSVWVHHFSASLIL